jgi:mannose-6-phosphate isomerase-like protein (cupin superfamily)
VSYPVAVPYATGELVGDTPRRRVEILADHGSLTATWSRFGPRREGADLHVHHEHTDLFYVLEGELTLRLGIDDDAVSLPAGTLARVPPDVVHGFRNGSDSELRFLNFHAPGASFANYLRALRDGETFEWDQHEPPADGERLRPLTDAVIGGGGVVADRPGLRIELLADTEAIAISESAGDPEGPSPPLHVHPRHVESFYVLEGELTFTVDGRTVPAPAGTWVQVPPGVPHTFAPAGTDRLRFLNLHTPGCGYGAFLRGLHEARSDADLAAVRAAFDQVPA